MQMPKYEEFRVCILRTVLTLLGRCLVFGYLDLLGMQTCTLGFQRAPSSVDLYT